IPGDFCAGAGAGAACSQKVDSTTWGVLSDLGYRFQWGRYFLEPLFTVSWVNSHFDNLNLLGAGVNANLGDGESTRIAGGFRTGGVLWGDNVRYLETSLTARVWDQVGGSNNVNFLDAGAPFTLTDKFSKVYGETSIQWDWINRGPGWSGFLK